MENHAEPHLRPESGSGAPVRLATRSSWNVGRESDNDLVVDDQLVSRRHAMFLRTEEGHFLLLDLGSRNGAFVNDVRIVAPTELRDQDRVRFGTHEFTYLDPSTRTVPSRGVGLTEDLDVGGAEDGMTLLQSSPQTSTILVVDIADFTGLSQRLDEAILAELIATWTRRCGTILRRHGVHAEKYIGDCVMAVWTHRGLDPDLSFVMKALRALAELGKFAHGLQEEVGLAAPLRLGAGLNTGPVLLANLGSQGAADHTALGESVNRVFRLETAAKQLGVDLLVGEESLAILRAARDIEAHFAAHRVELKGYDQSVRAYGVAFDTLPRLLSDLEAGATS